MRYFLTTGYRLAMYIGEQLINPPAERLRLPALDEGDAPSTLPCGQKMVKEVLPLTEEAGWRVIEFLASDWCPPPTRPASSWPAKHRCFSA
jgi:hypothetical protein